MRRIHLRDRKAWRIHFRLNLLKMLEGLFTVCTLGLCIVDLGHLNAMVEFLEYSMEDQ